MNKTEFEKVKEQYHNSGQSLKSFLKEVGVSYTTYNYWRMKLESEREVTTVNLQNVPLSPQLPRLSIVP